MNKKRPTVEGFNVHIKKDTFDYVKQRYVNDCKDGYIVKQTDGKKNGWSIITNGYSVIVVDNNNIIDYVESEDDIKENIESDEDM